MSTVHKSHPGLAVNQLAHELEKAIADERITIAKLTESTGLSRMQIWRLRTGDSKPSLETAEKVAKAIGLKLTFQRVRA